jgi:hypothetical protein
MAPIIKKRNLLFIVIKGRILLTSSPRVRGFWELPETQILPRASADQGEFLGSFRHSITRSQYRFEVHRAAVKGTPPGCKWWKLGELDTIPLSTATRKALRVFRPDDGKSTKGV